MHGRDRIRRTLAVGAITSCLVLAAAAPPPAHAGPLRSKLLRIIDRVRENHGMRAVRLNLRLSEDAKRHTRKMIRRGELFDPPNLRQLVEPYGWDDVAGAVVGCDGTLRALVRSWLASDPHRDILLHPKLRRAGIGVIRVEGRSACGRDRVWATAILYG